MSGWVWFALCVHLVAVMFVAGLLAALIGWNPYIAMSVAGGADGLLLTYQQAKRDARR